MEGIQHAVMHVTHAGVNTRHNQPRIMDAACEFSGVSAGIVNANKRLALCSALTRQQEKDVFCLEVGLLNPRRIVTLVGTGICACGKCSHCHHPSQHTSVHHTPVVSVCLSCLVVITETETVGGFSSFERFFDKNPYFYIQNFKECVLQD